MYGGISFVTAACQCELERLQNVVFIFEKGLNGQNGHAHK